MKSSAHIIGAGGIGIAAAACLARTGWDVTMIESNPKKVAAGRRNEMTLDGHPIHGTHFIHFDEWIPPMDAAVWCYLTAIILSTIVVSPSSPLNVPSPL